MIYQFIKYLKCDSKVHLNKGSISSEEYNEINNVFTRAEVFNQYCACRWQVKEKDNE